MKKEATLIYVDYEDQLGKEITAISKNHISGSVSLPDGAIAPKGGIKVSVHAEGRAAAVLQMLLFPKASPVQAMY